MHCPNCGTTVPAGNSFCHECGHDLRPRVAASQQAYAKPAKDPSVALLIELVGTLFGFMGFGWIYAGHTNQGIIRLLVWLGVVLVAAIITALTAGLFGCAWLPVQIVAAVVSGLQVKQAVERDNQLA